MSIRMYETIYIVKPDLADEENKALTTRINEVIETMNGEVRKLEDWGIRKLAYPINKLARGRYMYLRSDGDAALIAELERRLRLDEKRQTPLACRLRLGNDAIGRPHKVHAIVPNGLFVALFLQHLVLVYLREQAPVRGHVPDEAKLVRVV